MRARLAPLQLTLNWQTVLFLGYGDERGLNQTTNGLLKQDRAFFLKVSYALQRWRGKRDCRLSGRENTLPLLFRVGIECRDPVLDFVNDLFAVAALQEVVHILQIEVAACGKLQQDQVARAWHRDFDAV